MADDLDFLERFGPVLLDSYFVVDRERRIQVVNPAFTELLGLRPAERRSVKGRQCHELLKLDICQTRCVALSCLARNRQVRLEEVHGATSNGRELVLTLSAMPLRDAQGEIAGVFVTHRDVTDERRLMTRYSQERKESKGKVDALLRIIQDREAELAKLRGGS